MTHALVLLCGGLSTRMGTNKAFLPFGEYTLIEYQVRRFRPNFEKIYDGFLDESGRKTGLSGNS